MKKKVQDLYYADYLKLASLLNAQYPESAKHGCETHEETLFIITHQTYELWFKQILHELGSILKSFAVIPLDEKKLSTVAARLGRIVTIQKVINQQIGILETMTPLDFLDFRDYLTPASGFQSVQFREIELRLGLAHHKSPTSLNRLQPHDRDYLEQVAREPTLFDLVDAWLARIPFLEFDDFNFWKRYHQAVDTMLESDEQTIRNNILFDPLEIESQLKELEKTRISFNCLFEKDEYERLQKQGKFQLSQSATLSALFIHLYRDQPMLHLPFTLLTRLVEIDEQLTVWRSGHALMVERMLGSKIGTGGSSGHEYLRNTLSRKRIFADLFNLSTFLIPRSALPELTQKLKQNLGFYLIK